MKGELVIMKKPVLRIMLALVIVLTAVIGSASAVSAAPPAGTVTVTLPSSWSYDQPIYYRVTANNTASYGYHIYMVKKVGTVYTRPWDYTAMFTEGRITRDWTSTGWAQAISGNASGTYYLCVELVKKNESPILRHGQPKYYGESPLMIVP